jgi:hypothetical protein
VAAGKDISDKQENVMKGEKQPESAEPVEEYSGQDRFHADILVAAGFALGLVALFLPWWAFDSGSSSSFDLTGGAVVTRPVWVGHRLFPCASGGFELAVSANRRK